MHDHGTPAQAISQTEANRDRAIETLRRAAACAARRAVRPKRIATERLKHVAMPCDVHRSIGQTEANRDRAIETSTLRWHADCHRAGQTEANRDRAIETVTPAIAAGSSATVRPKRIATERLKHLHDDQLTIAACMVRPKRIATERLKHVHTGRRIAQMPVTSDRSESRPSD